jgi:hypothetical protein
MSEREDREPAGSGVEVGEARETELAQESPALPRLFSEMAGEEAGDVEKDGVRLESDGDEALIPGSGVAAADERELDQGVGAGEDLQEEAVTNPPMLGGRRKGGRRRVSVERRRRRGSVGSNAC